DGFRVILLGALTIALGLPQRTAIIPGALEFGIGLQRGIIVRDGMIEILQGLVGIAAIGPEIGIVGRELDRFIIVRDRAGVIAIGGEMQAAIVEIFRLGRIDPDRGGVVVQRAVGAADLAVSRAAVGVGLGVVGIEADRLVVVGDR